MTGAVVWITGLPGAGKTTLAWAVAARLQAAGLACCVLDGDEVRAALSPPPGHDPAGRAALYDTLAELAALLARQGLAVVVAATAHQRVFRLRARAAAPRFVEVYVATPAAVCEARDPKALWAAARAGRIAELPGVQAEYEAPEAPDVVAEDGLDPRAPERVLAALATGG